MLKLLSDIEICSPHSTRLDLPPKNTIFSYCCSIWTQMRVPSELINSQICYQKVALKCPVHKEILWERSREFSRNVVHRAYIHWQKPCQNVKRKNGLCHGSFWVVRMSVYFYFSGNFSAEIITSAQEFFQAFFYSSEGLASDRTLSGDIACCFVKPFIFRINKF